MKEKIAKMTVTDHNSAVQLWSSQFSVTVLLAIFFISDFLFHIYFSVVICDFLAIGSQITIVPMHVPFKIHYRNNLIDKKDSYLIPRLPSWDDRNYSYGHQLYPSGFFSYGPNYQYIRPFNKGWYRSTFTCLKSSLVSSDFKECCTRYS